MISSVRTRELAIIRGGRQLFQQFSFALGAGEAVALTGPNGSGKTSLLRAIAGLIRPAAGQVCFDGPGGELEPEEARGRGLHLVGHQDGLKTSRTAWDELLFQARWTGGDEASAEAALEALELKAVRGLEVREGLLRDQHHSLRFVFVPSRCSLRRAAGIGRMPYLRGHDGRGE